LKPGIAGRINASSQQPEFYVKTGLEGKTKRLSPADGLSEAQQTNA
jgi:hypothetical protein